MYCPRRFGGKFTTCITENKLIITFFSFYNLPARHYEKLFLSYRFNNKFIRNILCVSARGTNVSRKTIEQRDRSQVSSLKFYKTRYKTSADKSPTFRRLSQEERRASTEIDTLIPAVRRGDSRSRNRAESVTGSG